MDAIKKKGRTGGKRIKIKNVENNDTAISTENMELDAVQQEEELGKNKTENESAATTGAQKKSKRAKVKQSALAAPEEEAEATAQELTSKPAKCRKTDDSDKDTDDLDLDLASAERLANELTVEIDDANPTMRQKKKRKRETRIHAEKEQSAVKEQRRNEEYLQRWQTARESWKFEKLRQISIINSVLDPARIGDTAWPIALEYLSGSQGAARKQIVEMANKALEQLDGECASAKLSEEERQAIIQSEAYQRARAILQSLA